LPIAIGCPVIALSIRLTSVAPGKAGTEVEKGSDDVVNTPLEMDKRPVEDADVMFSGT
jgi:hypothetical protein